MKPIIITPAVCAEMCVSLNYFNTRVCVCVRAHVYVHAATGPSLLTSRAGIAPTVRVEGSKTFPSAGEDMTRMLQGMNVPPAILYIT